MESTAGGLGTRVPTATDLFMMCFPTSVEPVNPIFLTSGWSASLWPTSEPVGGSAGGGERGAQGSLPGAGRATSQAMALSLALPHSLSACSPPCLGFCVPRTELRTLKVQMLKSLCQVYHTQWPWTWNHHRPNGVEMQSLGWALRHSERSPC